MQWLLAARDDAPNKLAACRARLQSRQSPECQRLVESVDHAAWHPFAGAQPILHSILYSIVFIILKLSVLPRD